MGGKKNRNKRNPKPRGYWTVERALTEPRKGETISEFKRRAPGAYVVLRKHNLLGKRKFKTTMKPDWSVDTALQEAGKYKTRTEFRVHAGGAYSFLAKRHLLGKCSLEYARKQKGYWTKEHCFEIAEGCTTRGEICHKSKGAYSAIMRNNWWGEIPWIAPPMNLGVDGYCVYSYEFPDKCVYFGLTINPRRRHYEHIGRDKKSSVYKYHLKSGFPVPRMKIIQENLSAVDAKKMERELTKNAVVERGHKKVLNKAEPGSLGKPPLSWSDKTVEAAARKCKTKSEFIKLFKGAYNYALHHGLIGKFTFFEDGRKLYHEQLIINSYRRCYDIARKFDSRGKLSKAEPSIYTTALRHDWLKDYTWMKKSTRWTFEDCRKIALGDGSKKIFRENHPSAYMAAYRHKWVDLIFEKTRNRPVIQVDPKTGKTIKTWKGVVAARRAGFNNISRSISHGTPCKGYLFGYAD